MFALKLNLPSRRSDSSKSKRTTSGNPYNKETVYISSIIAYIYISAIELVLPLKALKDDIFGNSFFFSHNYRFIN